MTERRRLITAVLLVAGMALRLMTLSACGGSPDNQIAVEIAFTPTPTIIVVRDCGDGVLMANEVCDASAPNGDAACTSQGKSCLCCACLGPDETLGTRAFSIARPGSEFRNSVLGCTDASVNPWLEGPLMIEAGRPDPETCVAPLRLAEDVIIGFIQPIGAACLKITAADSEGSIDCDGGTTYDVEYEQDSNGSEADSPPVIRRGLGDPTQTGASGAADLYTVNLISILLTNPPGQPLPGIEECLAIDYDNPTSDPRIQPANVTMFPWALTTRNGRAIVLEPVQGPPPGQTDINCPGTGSTVTGQNFSCGRFSQEDSEGIFIGPLNALGQLGGALDTANTGIFADRATP